MNANDPLGNLTSWSYDAAGNVVSERRPDNAVNTLAYDAMNRAVSVKDAKSQTTTMAYDAMDNLLKLTDARGSVTQFAYDLCNRRLSKTYANGSAESRTYDPMGNHGGGNDEVIAVMGAGGGRGTTIRRCLGGVLAEFRWISFVVGLRVGGFPAFKCCHGVLAPNVGCSFWRSVAQA